ncbi:DNA/RNA nuclease SfsA [Aurantivibrio plasticivorans]
MKFNPPLIKGRFVRRYKRFFADVELESGETVTAHCPNTGSMKNCLVEGSPCWISKSDNPKRKLAYTWEIATVPGRKKAGVNTGRANALVEEAIKNGVIEELQGYSEIRREVPYGAERSRIDFFLAGHAKQKDCYVEVKNVTLALSKGVGAFPDSISERGQKHLRELMSQVDKGYRAVLLFCVQHTGIEHVVPADDIDVRYGELLREALYLGVEVLAYRAALTAREIAIKERIAFSAPELYE